MAIVAASTATNAWLMQPVLDEVFLNKNTELLLLVPIAVMTIAIVKGVHLMVNQFLWSTRVKELFPM